MAMVGQSSFRRILLLRILLLSIPILFLGMAVTFRKARSSLLQTARQNLEQSAVRKAETIQDSINALQTSMAIASETAPLQFGSPVTASLFLKQLQPQLPTDVRCLQLKDLETAEMIASTCGNLVLDQVATQDWPKQRQPGDLNHLQTHTLTINQLNRPPQTDNTSQLTLLLSTPVYNTTGQLRYSLTAQTVIKQTESSAPWLLQGNTIVINEKGTFLAHPLVGKVGLNIAQAGDSDRFQDILNNIQRGDTDSRHLFNLEGNATEWIAGFSPLTVPVTAKERETWAVLAVTPADSALQGLDDITQILLILTVGLLAAHLLAMLYMARDLALPIEQLGKYAQRILKRDSSERAPKNFRIRELNHLAEVLDNMVGRLEERAKELESAWQEAEAANQLKSEFLANTSHELRTPLNAIIGCIRLVKDGCCDSREEEVEFLQQADKAAIHLLKIINDLLDIQRIEEKKLPLSFEVIDLRQILKDVVDLEAVQIQQKGLELHVMELVEPIMVRVDPARLKQVLLNIIYNAIKFTDQGSISLQIRLEQAEDVVTRPANQPVGQNGHRADHDGEDDTEWVVIAIQDTGIGIDPAQQHKLFRPFVMVDGSTTRKFEGTGLGLAISRNLVEMMGGQISLHSAGLGHGTTVKVVLPIFSTTPESSNGQDPPKEAASVTEPAVKPTVIS
ncbi:MAG: two-component sensor histidine kinase [Elainella sp. C42_A2020_010]|nr:two-component sensor histidine kinase [Elainella sp. C42_A2020_010]RNJ66450.1 MAG: sensor histidine kinase [Leptolyngbya sp. IPPAS B-1204]